MNYEEIVDKFNSGDLDVENYFNDYDTFFNILKKRGYMSQVDPTAPDSEEWQNEFLIWLYQADIKKFHEYVVLLLNDDLVMDENGKIFYVTNDRSELSKLFCNGRDELSSHSLEQILSGEGDVWEPYWSTTDDVYRDVIEELTPENDKRLQEYIVETLKDSQIEPETEELELIATEQGHPEYANITPENVKRVIDDKETMEYLFDNELGDLKFELESLHDNSYNTAYESEVWRDIWSKVNEYFDGDGEWIERPHKYKKETMVQTFKIPVSSNFDSIILDYLNDNKGYGNSGTLEYFGSYIDLLNSFVDCLSVYPPDFPDFREVDKNINEYFRDYI